MKIENIMVCPIT